MLIEITREDVDADGNHNISVMRILNGYDPVIEIAKWEAASGMKMVSWREIQE